MTERIRVRPHALGDAYHRLFMGEDSDTAEAAAHHLADTLEAIRAFLTRPPQ